MKLRDGMIHHCSLGQEWHVPSPRLSLGGNTDTKHSNSQILIFYVHPSVTSPLLAAISGPRDYYQRGGLCADSFLFCFGHRPGDGRANVQGCDNYGGSAFGAGRARVWQVKLTCQESIDVDCRSMNSIVFSQCVLPDT